jgi:hypothetical protein
MVALGGTRNSPMSGVHPLRLNADRPTPFFSRIFQVPWIQFPRALDTVVVALTRVCSGRPRWSGGPRFMIFCGPRIPGERLLPGARTDQYWYCILL